ncbi:MAG: uridine kinase [Bdellovibrionaceae bacterium]|nr:uridine kinase [Pseudobdellovibrionaceae bacterium]|tara:strand:- start:27829 stop:28443 length:615 start_codon:yes stop_codon:yes gene_type:complete
MTPKIIAVAGGSCSGKTSFCKRFREQIGEENCLMILQDNYYFDQSDRFDEDGGAVNFDHPESLEFSLMKEQLVQLKAGKSVELPLYDFTTHTRRTETLLVEPKPIILVDGILILSQENLRDVFDDSIFIQCDRDRRFTRRLQRDTIERGRTPEGVKAQFDKQVEPMHIEFVEPSKDFAKTQMSQEEYLENGDKFIKDKIKELSL